MQRAGKNPIGGDWDARITIACALLFLKDLARTINSRSQFHILTNSDRLDNPGVGRLSISVRGCSIPLFFLVRFLAIFTPAVAPTPIFHKPLPAFLPSLLWQRPSSIISAEANCYFAKSVPVHCCSWSHAAYFLVSRFGTRHTALGVVLDDDLAFPVVCLRRLCLFARGLPNLHMRTHRTATYRNGGGGRLTAHSMFQFEQSSSS